MSVEGATRALVGAAVVAALALARPGAGRADPSVWARARDPAMSARADVLARADALIKRATRGELGDRVAADRAEDYLREARKILEEGGAEGSSGLVLRHRYGEVLYRLGDYERAAAILESIRTCAPPPVRRQIAHSLALAYAHLDRHRDEIVAYTDELELEPHAPRAIILANRAEAYMALGDLPNAVDGYRQALTSLTQPEMFEYGVTTLWGLAVASDRAGDPEEALGVIQMARSYDPFDRKISSPDSWFWNPPHEEFWYRALGNWSTARQTDQAAVRAEAYARAVALWDRYIAAAPPGDPWLPIAKVRRKQVDKERSDRRVAVWDADRAEPSTPQPRPPRRTAAPKPRSP